MGHWVTNFISTTFKLLAIASTSISVYDKYHTTKKKHAKTKSTRRVHLPVPDNDHITYYDIDVVYDLMAKAKKYNRYLPTSKKIKVIFVNAPEGKQFCLDYYGQTFINLD